MDHYHQENECLLSGRAAENRTRRSRGKTFVNIIAISLVLAFGFKYLEQKEHPKRADAAVRLDQTRLGPHVWKPIVARWGFPSMQPPPTTSRTMETESVCKLRNFPKGYDNRTWPEYNWQELLKIHPDNPNAWPKEIADKGKLDSKTWCSANYGMTIYAQINANLAKMRAGKRNLYEGYQITDVSQHDDVLFFSIKSPVLGSQSQGNNIFERLIYIYDGKYERFWGLIVRDHQCKIYTARETGVAALCGQMDPAYTFKFLSETEISEPVCPANDNDTQHFQRCGEHLNSHCHRNMTISLEAWEWTNPGSNDRVKYVSPPGSVLDLLLARFENSSNVFPLIHVLDYDLYGDDEFRYDFVVQDLHRVTPDNFKLPHDCENVTAVDLDLEEAEEETLNNKKNQGLAAHFSNRKHGFHGGSDSSSPHPCPFVRAMSRNRA